MEGKRHKGGSAHQLASVPANSGGAALQPVTSSEITKALVLASYHQPPDGCPIQQTVRQELVSYTIWYYGRTIKKFAVHTKVHFIVEQRQACNFFTE